MNLLFFALLFGAATAGPRRLGQPADELTLMCEHHFKPQNNKFIESMIHFEQCAMEKLKEKFSQLKNCIGHTFKGLSYALGVCDKKDPYREEYMKQKACINTNTFTQDDHDVIKKCVSKSESRQKRSMFFHHLRASDSVEKFCENTITHYYMNHPSLRDVIPSCVEKLYPNIFTKRRECDKILDLHNINTLKDVCDGKLTAEYNKKKECERNSQLSQEEHKKVFDCAVSELKRKDWDRAARGMLLTPYQTFDEFCAKGWALPWGNFSGQHHIWMTVEKAEARANLEKYTKRTECHTFNFKLACQNPSKNEAEYQKNVQCLKQYPLTQEEIEKMKVDLIENGVDPSYADLEVKYEENLTAACNIHRQVDSAYGEDLSLDSLQCIENDIPGFINKLRDCRKNLAQSGEELMKQCMDREKWATVYQQGRSCMEEFKPLASIMTVIMKCANAKAAQQTQQLSDAELTEGQGASENR